MHTLPFDSVEDYCFAAIANAFFEFIARTAFDADCLTLLLATTVASTTQSHQLHYLLLMVDLSIDTLRLWKTRVQMSQQIRRPSPPHALHH